jgi:hypothetical protein
MGGSCAWYFRHAPITWRAGLLLEQCKDLGHDGVVVHHPPSTCPSAASAWGNQKVISMAR